VALLTSYHGKWLGDPSFDPVMQELDRGQAVTYTHPTAPSCCHNLFPVLLPDTAIEFGTDTTRAIASLMFRGTATRFPHIRWIFSHGGGTVPFLIERMVIVGQSKSIASNIPQGVEVQLRRFYYDIAQIVYPAPIAALAKVAEPSHILWGTDFPFRHGEEYVQRLPACGLSVSELRRIERENALPLFPRLRID
jgi:6-methylsalicylate decarboxylase